MKVSDAVVEVALDVVLGEGVVDCSTDAMRRALRAALEAALPMVVEVAAVEHLRALVDALDKAFISTWQSTAYWQGELDAARDFLTNLEQQP